MGCYLVRKPSDRAGRKYYQPLLVREREIREWAPGSKN